MKVRDITNAIEEFAPLRIQEDWDNSGLTIGSHDDEVHKVGASIGQKINPFYKVMSQHNGVDLVAGQGTPVLAAGNGIVEDVIRSGKGLGNIVKIAHDDGFVTVYAHLEDIVVRKGERVTAGRKIANVGISGNSFAPHLHYEVYKDGKVMDPVNYFFASFTPAEYAKVAYMAATTGQSMD